MYCELDCGFELSNVGQARSGSRGEGERERRERESVMSANVRQTYYILHPTYYILHPAYGIRHTPDGILQTAYYIPYTHPTYYIRHLSYIRQPTYCTIHSYYYTTT